MGATEDLLLNTSADIRKNERVLAQEVDKLRDETDGSFETLFGTVIDGGNKVEFNKVPTVGTIANNRVTVWVDESAFTDGGEFETAIIDSVDTVDTTGKTLVLKDNSENTDFYAGKYVTVFCKVDPTPSVW